MAIRRDERTTESFVYDIFIVACTDKLPNYGLNVYPTWLCIGMSLDRTGKHSPNIPIWSTTVQSSKLELLL